MIHQKGTAKLNCKFPHRRAMLRNQVIQLIMQGKLVTTKARVKEARRLAEKLVTVARQGNNFNARRRAYAMLPYKQEALLKLFNEKMITRDAALEYSSNPEALKMNMQGIFLDEARRILAQ